MTKFDKFDKCSQVQKLLLVAAELKHIISYYYTSKNAFGPNAWPETLILTPCLETRNQLRSEG